MKAKLVLVADENSSQAKALKANLEALGYKVEIARNGSTAEKTAVNLLPDLVILDVTMPMKSGYAVARFLKRYEKTKLIPIILMSKRRISEVDIELGYKSGAAYYLTKPLDEKLLHKALRMLLRDKVEAKPAGQVIPLPSTEEEVL